MVDGFSISDVMQRFASFAEAKETSIDVEFADSELMIARCVLPMVFVVQDDDVLKGGVAVRATLAEVEVRPYLLRQVCTNGMIMIRSAAGSTVSTAECTDAWLSEAFAGASSLEAFNHSALKVQTLAGTSFDRSFLYANLLKLTRGFDSETVRESMRRMISGGTSDYSLMNAITSVARDTKAPETRWRLGAAGDAVPAILLDGPPSGSGLDGLEIPTSPNLDREPQPA